MASRGARLTPRCLEAWPGCARSTWDAWLSCCARGARGSPDRFCACGTPRFRSGCGAWCARLVRGPTDGFAPLHPDARSRCGACLHSVRRRLARSQPQAGSRGVVAQGILGIRLAPAAGRRPEWCHQVWGAPRPYPAVCARGTLGVRWLHGRPGWGSGRLVASSHSSPGCGLHPTLGVGGALCTRWLPG